MKKLLGTLAFACIIQFAFAQKISVVGVIIDEKNKQPIDGAIININNEYIITKEDGIFIFSKIEAKDFILKNTEENWIPMENLLPKNAHFENQLYKEVIRFLLDEKLLLVNNKNELKSV